MLLEAVFMLRGRKMDEDCTSVLCEVCYLIFVGPKLTATPARDSGSTPTCFSCPPTFAGCGLLSRSVPTTLNTVNGGRSACDTLAADTGMDSGYKGPDGNCLGSDLLLQDRQIVEGPP